MDIGYDIQPWETTIVYSVYNISNSKEERGGNADEKSEFRKYGKTGSGYCHGMYGSMKELTVKEAAKLVDAAMAEGVDFFDHADIYGGESAKSVLKRRRKSENKP